MRVLCPGGTLINLNRKSKIQNRQLRKPVPPNIDEWPHYLHGPDNNAVARDTVVGPPRRMQWVAGPRYARSDEINSSMAAMVSAGCGPHVSTACCRQTDCSTWPHTSASATPAS